jgi:hypothetical protein
MSGRAWRPVTASSAVPKARNPDIRKRTGRTRGNSAGGDSPDRDLGSASPGRRYRAIRGWGNRVSRRSETIGRMAGTRAPRFAVTDTNSPDASIARVQLDHRSLGRTGHFASSADLRRERLSADPVGVDNAARRFYRRARRLRHRGGGAGRVGGIMFGSMLWRVASRGFDDGGFLVETQYQDVADQVDPVSNDVTGMSCLRYAYGNATF